MKKTTWAVAILLTMLPGTFVSGQSNQSFSVPLSEPGKPVRLEASLLYGGIRVVGHDSDEIAVEVLQEQAESEGRRSDGMRVIPNSSLGLVVEEERNHVEVRGNWASKIELLTIRVPRRTSMSLGCTNGGDIHVEAVEGELELRNTNGSVTALEIRGSVVAHTTNGDVTVSFIDLTADRAMSFVTFNGDADVTFPPDLRADLRISAGQGDIFTDFEFEVRPQSPSANPQREGGKFRLELNREVHAVVGGGGPEMQFKTWSGDIFIRSSSK